MPFNNYKPQGPGRVLWKDSFSPSNFILIESMIKIELVDAEELEEIIACESLVAVIFGKHRLTSDFVHFNIRINNSSLFFFNDTFQIY